LAIQWLLFIVGFGLDLGFLGSGCGRGGDDNSGSPCDATSFLLNMFHFLRLLNNSTKGAPAEGAAVFDG